MPNMFSIADAPLDQERIDLLAEGDELRIERIVSQGHASPPDFWYEQDLDEWVLLLQGEAILRFEHDKVRILRTGDWLFLPAGLRHRVDRTSAGPPCIWLAVHGRFTEHQGPILPDDAHDEERFS